MTADLPPDLLLRAYAMGIFPMAEARDDPTVHWVDPRKRGVFPLDGFHCSRSLARRMRGWGFEVRCDTAFAAVLDACADRDETWINATIRAGYLGLHAAGHAHSVEVWDAEGLAGGVYGVTLGARVLRRVDVLGADGRVKGGAGLPDPPAAGGRFRLFDTQFLTPHLASLGAVEISRAEYHRRLAEAIALPAVFDPPGYSPSVSSVLSDTSGGV